MLTTLHTMKAEPISIQARMIEELADRLDPLYDWIKAAIRREQSELLPIEISLDRKKVIVAALLAVIEADIVTLPSSIAREPYQKAFETLCQNFEISQNDLLGIRRYASQIEAFLKSK